nr:MAG TPA: hypothetical protein [Caudoviricetes sp.]
MFRPQAHRLRPGIGTLLENPALESKMVPQRVSCTGKPWLNKVSLLNLQGIHVNMKVSCICTI